MAINYQMTPVPVSIIGGESWMNQDIPDAILGEEQDGVADNGNIPLIMKISPIDPSTYYVKASSFKISGQSQTSIVDAVPWTGAQYTISNTYVFDPTVNTSIILPNSVSQVKMWNSISECSPNNEVYVAAFLEDDYIINQDTTITLDIDGDANLTSEILVVDEEKFTISVVLKGVGDNPPNCTVVPFLHGPDVPYSTFSWNQEITATGGTTGTIEFDLGSSAQTFDQLTGNVMTLYQHKLWFWIIPDDGYVLSRHNLWLTHTGGTTTTGAVVNDYGSFDENTNVFNMAFSNNINVISGLNYFENVPLVQDSSGNMVPDFPIEFQPSLGTNIVSNRGTIYKNVDIEITSYQGSPCATSITTTGNYNNDISYINNFNDTLSSIGLFDTRFGIGSQGIPFPSPSTITMNGYGWSNIYGLTTNSNSGGTGEMPDTQCPLDYQGNAVYMRLLGVGSYQPSTQNSADIVINVYGAATPLDGSECVDGGGSSDEG